LVRLYWPAELRPAFDALFAIDHAMADVVVRSTEPRLAAIKLAWWRERLEELDDGKVPAEPRLQAAAEHLLSRGVTGAELSRLEDGWLMALQTESWGDDEIEAFQPRGTYLFSVAAKLLGHPNDQLAKAGAAWALVDLARRKSDVADQMHLLLHAGFLAEAVEKHRVPRRLRPLTMFSALARRDAIREPLLEPQATPGRAWTLLRHRLTGRL